MTKRNSTVSTKLKRATDADIYSIAIPGDSSYAQEIGYFDMPPAIGEPKIINEEIDLRDKKVVICSVPFIDLIKRNRPKVKPIKREFIHVMLDGKLYQILNVFIEIGIGRLPDT